MGRPGLIVAMLSFPRTVLSLKQSTEPTQVHAASLGVITLQVKALGSSPTWAHFAVVIEGVLGLLLIALLALALRRKFMRA